MYFPISVHFNKQLQATITSGNKQAILKYIETCILEDKADNVVLENMCVSYKGSTSNSRGSLFGSVDDGFFNLIYKNGSWWLCYQINMRELFATTGIMAGIAEVFMLVNGGPWWVGIVMFLWLCGANWVIILIRHGSVATTIAAGIDELICGKIEEPEYEHEKIPGKLKSWF